MLFGCFILFKGAGGRIEEKLNSRVLRPALRVTTAMQGACTKRKQIIDAAYFQAPLRYLVCDKKKSQTMLE